MITIRHKIQILNEFGLHARTAAKVVKTASKFTSQIQMTFNSKTANAKDIIEIMMLGATQHSWVELLISGENDSENKIALSQMTTLLKRL